MPNTAHRHLVLRLRPPAVSSAFACSQHTSRRQKLAEAALKMMLMQGSQMNLGGANGTEFTAPD
tara:strand:+ start:598 stop:789 length:192 start_codon:yes stop_codon:yes gene_type:complete